MPKKTVTVQIPASTSNCGPGFDCLSIALSLYNFVRLTVREDTVIAPVGEANAGTQAMVEEAALSFAQTAGLDLPGFDYEIWGDVPLARGLGSSSTVRAGIVAGLNELVGNPLDEEAAIRLTTKLDSSPDNATAAFSGGFCIARTDPTTFAYQHHIRFELPGTLAFAAVAPDYKVMTDDSRRVLPETLSFKDVVRTTNSLAYLVGVLATGDFERLRGAVHDCIHQPYRELLNPFGHESIEAGCSSGAYAGWLSGSGSTVVCPCPADKVNVVLDAMTQAYAVNDIKSRSYRLLCDNDGLTVNED
ncbi:homoserine kinase [Coraliomargarita sinensis]|uniref:Homoserine kinase n=1 Tax=Coraliomargarita sinensis TaxID=2174842 RepID=A0A317ZP54_9BACT|nr:homoserine kinase [Coraliomargarita sinensis]PXA05131.1 homoserine kinase [Coraliomargarita sinensis]